MYTIRSLFSMFVFNCLYLLLPLFLQTGISALYGACRNGHTRVVEQLLEAKANPNILDCVSLIMLYCV